MRFSICGINLCCESQIHVNVSVKGSKTAPGEKHCFREEQEQEMVGLLLVVLLLLLPGRQTDGRQKASERATGQLLLSAAPGTNNGSD